MSGGADGTAAIYDSGDTTHTWQISSLHGDVVATIRGGDAGLSATSRSSDYGTPADPADVGNQRYGWLGAEQRAADTPSGIVLMGVRLYNTVTGRFLSVDPVAGGSCNRYEYACGDPINRYDLDGKAIPAIIAAIVVAARAIYTACRVARSWCARALKWSGNQILKAAGRLTNWVWANAWRLASSARFKCGLNCAKSWGDLIGNTMGDVARVKFGWSGAAKVVGWAVGFVVGYATNKRCTAKEIH